MCKVLRVNRSTYYKHFSAESSPRIKENQYIASLILHIYADYNKRLGAYKITYVLQRDYGINISVGRVYRLMKQLQLPKMSTDKPAIRSNSSDTEACCNHLQQKFNQKAPNPVWVSDITYIKAGGIWYYLCIVMDLFSRKVISWHISSKANVELVITAFKKAYEKRNAPYGLMFHSDRGSSILPSPSGGFSTLLMLCSLFLRKVILLTMLAVNVFSSISKKKKQIANVIVRLRSFSYLFLNILKGITTQKDRTERLICLRQMKQKLYIGSRQNSLLPLKKLYFFVSTYLTIVQR